MHSSHYYIKDWMEVRDILGRQFPKMYTYKSYRPASIYLPPSNKWDLGCGWSGALSMARDSGWPEGASSIRRLSDKYIDKITSSVYVKQYVYDVQGLSFDVGMLMQGEPEHWIRTEDTDIVERRSGKLYSVLINNAASSTIQTDEIARRGAATAALVYLLESTGTSTALDVTNKVVNVANTYSLRIDISLKKHGEPLDLDRLALITIHPAGLRRIMFKIKEQITTDEDRRAILIYAGTNRGYGVPVDITPEERTGVDIYGPAMVRSQPHPFISDDSTEEWIKQQLRKIGVINE